MLSENSWLLPAIKLTPVAECGRLPWLALDGWRNRDLTFPSPLPPPPSEQNMQNGPQTEPSSVQMCMLTVGSNTQNFRFS